MDLEREKVIERIKEAKSYGLSYSKLAREIGLQPVAIYMFKNGNTTMAKQKQLKALCYIEKYIDEVKEQLRIIEHKELCTKWNH